MWNLFNQALSQASASAFLLSELLLLQVPAKTATQSMLHLPKHRFSPSSKSLCVRLLMLEWDNTDLSIPQVSAQELPSNYAIYLAKYLPINVYYLHDIEKL